MTDDTTTPTTLAELDLERVSRDEARDADHVLESAVEVWEEYEQRYDPDANAVLLGPTRIEDQCNAYTQYDCTCGKSFTDQDEALQHLIAEAEDDTNKE